MQPWNLISSHMVWPCVVVSTLGCKFAFVIEFHIRVVFEWNLFFWNILTYFIGLGVFIPCCITRDVPASALQFPCVMCGIINISERLEICHICLRWHPWTVFYHRSRSSFKMKCYAWQILLGFELCTGTLLSWGLLSVKAIYYIVMAIIICIALNVNLVSRSDPRVWHQLFVHLRWCMWL